MVVMKSSRPLEPIRAELVVGNGERLADSRSKGPRAEERK